MRNLQRLIFIGDDHVYHDVAAIQEIVISLAIYDPCKTSLSSMVICLSGTSSPPMETDGNGDSFP